jgi:uncharacterized protein involved in copper resistance
MFKMLNAVALGIALPAAALAQTAPASNPAVTQAKTCADHSKMTGMEHSTMSGMDMSGTSMSGMDHSKMSGMNMSGMDHSKMAGCAALAKPAVESTHPDHSGH